MCTVPLSQWWLLCRSIDAVRAGAEIKRGTPYGNIVSIVIVCVRHECIPCRQNTVVQHRINIERLIQCLFYIDSTLSACRDTVYHNVRIVVTTYTLVYLHLFVILQNVDIKMVNGNTTVIIQKL